MPHRYLRDLRGEDHPSARLTEADIRAIRARRREGWLVREIAAERGVATPTISKILGGRSWSHVLDDPPNP